MVKTVDISEWYGLLLEPENRESGEAFLQEMDELMSGSGDKNEEHSQEAVSYLGALLKAQYLECRCLIGFVLANNGSDEVRFDQASISAFKRHGVADQMMLLSWAGISTKQEECKRRIREVCNGILRLVGYDDVQW